jgi:hypothetical protein
MRKLGGAPTLVVGLFFCLVTFHGLLGEEGRGVRRQGIASEIKPAEVLEGVRGFFKKTALPDGSFRPGIDPAYKGFSDTAYSDLAAVTYAVVLHKTFGWILPEKTVAFLLARQKEDGAFVNVQGAADPKTLPSAPL